MSTYTAGYFVGSLAEASINRKLARALTRLAPPHLHMREIPIGDLPLYCYDYDSDFPPAGARVEGGDRRSRRRSLRHTRVQPLHPGRSQERDRLGEPSVGQNSFSRKPSAIIGTSPGKIGTAVGQQHLRSILSFCNSPQMNAIEAYIQFTPGLITDDGDVTVDSTAEFLRSYMSEFHAFITRVYTALPRDDA